MSLLINWFSLFSIAWGFQILQKNNDVSIQTAKDVVQEVRSGEGELKFVKEGMQFDLLAHTQLVFGDGNLVLNQGEFRLRGEKLESLKVVTPVAVLTLSGGDFVVHYSTEKAIASVEVLLGSALIQGHYHEELLNVQKSERGQFIGVPEATGPAFDLLLKGRKMIRGALAGPESLNEAGIKELTAHFDIPIKATLKKVKPKAKPGQICAEPFAKFGECVWRCQHNPAGKKECQTANQKVHCVREKCLASGAWGDSVDLNGNKKQECSSAPEKIAPCNY